MSGEVKSYTADEIYPTKEVSGSDKQEPRNVVIDRSLKRLTENLYELAGDIQGFKSKISLTPPEPRGYDTSRNDEDILSFLDVLDSIPNRVGMACDIIETCRREISEIKKKLQI